MSAAVIEAALRAPALSSLVAHNLALLQQGAALILHLEDRFYSDAPDHLHNASVGAHVRHCLDFYQCLLDGVEGGTVDHTRRTREARVEQNRFVAIEIIRSVSWRLAKLGQNKAVAEGVLALRVDHDEDLLVPTTVARELEAAASHTIHHFAVIAVVLRAQGIEIADDFGVAPSTLRHWKR
jgi:hypothetical protein